jgi:hypothetical protein
MDDMTRLGLTTWFNDNAKGRGGYNFAFPANRFNEYQGKQYGKECVLFRASGIQVYHYGDEQHQVIFWGKDSRDRIPITAGINAQWALPNDDHDKPVFENDDLNIVVNWVVANFPQYRRVLVK